MHKKIQAKFVAIALDGIRHDRDALLQVMLKGSIREDTASVDLNSSSAWILLNCYGLIVEGGPLGTRGEVLHSAL